MTGAYLHIPFCEHICYYCDFNKVFLEGQPVDEYIDRLITEMRLVMATHPAEKIKTIYVGGGTPTTLTPKQLAHLLAGIRRYLPFEEGEFTFEANPNDLLTIDKLQVLRDYGVNRLSIGVQSFNDEILKKIGRIHTSANVYTAIKNARKVGFDNISIDLIFRLPGQSIADFTDSLDRAIALDLPHYATYSLILERKTVFYNMMRQGKLFLPTQDTEADMYELAIEKFAQAGRAQYEISNFALPGMESQHNLIYWRNEKYFGFGAGAHGYLGKDRYQNFGPIQQYLQPLRANKLPVFEHRVLSLSEQIEEEMFLGLRKMEGVSQSRFEEKFHLTIEAVYGQTVNNLIKRGLMKQQGDRLSLTKRGEFLGNDVFQEFLIDEAI
ncbi:radical SAM family heme chaperone HemW [Loigolactobacillus iwatensis]|uniref:radical SAM family heme chaperone HemW n=1 Tax=Loigolactobacillus iwatensis TaxID=1267156 RepID=UPI000F7E3EB4|nr:radical SAM family heme chaperone HemW [Loigolactobacillus iwatensis]